MKMLGKNIYIRIAAIITAVFMALMLPGEMVFAAPVSMAKIDMSQKGSLTVTHLSCKYAGYSDFLQQKQSACPNDDIPMTLSSFIIIY